MSQKPLEIVYWIESGGKMGAWLIDRIQRYNASQSNYIIKPVYEGEYNQLQDLMMRTFTDKDAEYPVLASLDYKLVQWFAKQGYTASLSKLFPKTFLDDYYPCLMEDMMYEGEVYGLPYNRSNQGLYINCDLFRKSGLDPQKPPKNWDEFIAAGQKITNAEKDTFGTYSLIAAQWWFELYVLQAGGAVCDDEGNFIFNNEAGVEAGQYLQDEVYKYKFARIPDVYLAHHGKLSESASQFVEGRIGMFRSSPAMRQSLIESNVNFEWAFVPVPAGKAGRAVTNGGANTIIISRATDEQKAGAVDFMKFMASSETIIDWVKFTGYIPVRRSVAESDELQLFYKENPYYSVCYEQLPYIKPTSLGTKLISGWQRTIDPAITRIINQKEDVKRVLDETVADLQKQLKSSRS